MSTHGTSDPTVVSHKLSRAVQANIVAKLLAVMHRLCRPQKVPHNVVKAAHVWRVIVSYMLRQSKHLRIPRDTIGYAAMSIYVCKVFCVCCICCRQAVSDKRWTWLSDDAHFWIWHDEADTALRNCRGYGGGMDQHLHRRAMDIARPAVARATPGAVRLARA
eukprot:6491791-Amphidinium_carterae.1